MWYIFRMSIPPVLPPQKKPHPARHVFSIAGISLFTVLIIGSFFFAAGFMRSLVQSNQLAAVITATLVDLTNNDRKADSIGTLKINPKLVEAAQAKADDMAAKGYFAHNSPEGLTSWYWFEQVKYSFSYAGENLAVNFSDSEDVEQAWMDSPTHRANILNGKFTEIGIATAVGEYKGKTTTFVVQMFGRPQTNVAFAPVNESTQPTNPEEIAVASTQDAPATTVLGSSVPAPAAATSAPVSGTAVNTPDTVPANVIAEGNAPHYSNLWDFLMSSPQNLLRSIYVICAIIIVAALAFTTELEFKRHHFRHMVAAVLLIALMGGLFTVADKLVFKPPVIGDNFVSSNFA
jgi:uncharacterized protein YkwD